MLVDVVLWCCAPIPLALALPFCSALPVLLSKPFPYEVNGLPLLLLPYAVLGAAKAYAKSVVGAGATNEGTDVREYGATASAFLSVFEE